MVRHGETVFNQERRIQGGSSDIELSDLGKKQANALASSLKETRVDAIYSSPMKRAMSTAEAIASYHGLSVCTDHSLRELEAGDLEGVSIEDLGNNFTKFLVEWRDAEGRAKLPGGESLADLDHRVGEFVQQIMARHKNEAVVIVSHFFVTVLIICKALGIPISELGRIRIQVASVSILDFTDAQPCLVMLGDTCHLSER